MSSGLMDTEPGGESTQYESIQTVTKPHSKEEGQMSVKQTQPDSMPLAQDKEKAEKGERIAENVRYGEAISEHGFGGETTGISGSVNQGGVGPPSALGQDSDDEQSRKEQGYGHGSGVGA